jgi:hypothetical protein
MHIQTFHNVVANPIKKEPVHREVALFNIAQYASQVKECRSNSLVPL